MLTTDHLIASSICSFSALQIFPSFTPQISLPSPSDCLSLCQCVILSLEITSSLTPNIFLNCPQLITSFLPQNIHSQPLDYFKFYPPKIPLPVHYWFPLLPSIFIYFLPRSFYQDLPPNFSICLLLMTSFLPQHVLSTAYLMFFLHKFPYLPTADSLMLPQCVHALP